MLPELTTNQKGAIAESAIVHEAIKLGIEVYRPVSEGGRFDLIFVLGDRLVRVQCKWAPRRRDRDPLLLLPPSARGHAQAPLHG